MPACVMLTVAANTFIRDAVMKGVRDPRMPTRCVVMETKKVHTKEIRVVTRETANQVQAGS
jgi:hypothetical protein